VEEKQHRHKHRDQNESGNKRSNESIEELSSEKVSTGEIKNVGQSGSEVAEVLKKLKQAPSLTPERVAVFSILVAACQYLERMKKRQVSPIAEAEITFCGSNGGLDKILSARFGSVLQALLVSTDFSTLVSTGHYGIWTLNLAYDYELLTRCIDFMAGKLELDRREIEKAIKSMSSLDVVKISYKTPGGDYVQSVPIRNLPLTNGRSSSRKRKSKSKRKRSSSQMIVIETESSSENNLSSGSSAVRGTRNNLHKWAEDGNSKKIAKDLQKNPLNRNKLFEENELGLTPLMLAAKLNNVNVVSAILHVAVKFDLLSELINQRSCSWQTDDNLRNTVCQLALEQKDTSRLNTEDASSVHNTQFKLVKTLLSYGAPVILCKNIIAAKRRKGELTVELKKLSSPNNHPQLFDLLSHLNDSIQTIANQVNEIKQNPNNAKKCVKRIMKLLISDGCSDYKICLLNSGVIYQGQAVSLINAIIKCGNRFLLSSVMNFFKDDQNMLRAMLLNKDTCAQSVIAHIVKCLDPENHTDFLLQGMIESMTGHDWWQQHAEPLSNGKSGDSAAIV